MSVSVDDLVDSLSSNHIGQEAIDLAVLQTQLAETLFGGPSTTNNANIGAKSSCSPRGRRSKVQVCTTPTTARTPSVSSNNGWGMAVDTSRSRRNSVSCSYLEDMEEDEKMVEDLLMPSPPLSASLSGAHFGAAFLPTAFQDARSSPIHTSSGIVHPTNDFSDLHPSSPAASLFATTDPFYLAQLQSINNVTPRPQSVFAQNACLTQTSPFAHSVQWNQLNSSSHSAGMTGNQASMPFGAF